MTVSTTRYYEWNSRNDSLVAPFNSCSPNLLSLHDFYRRTVGATNLGCHVQRAISGSGSLSSHAWGAATDERFPSREITVVAMDFTIAYSAELGINTIHDYTLQRKWDPIIGWHSASIGSVGGDWIHVETTPAAFGDGRPVEDKLPGSQQGEAPMTPQDQAYIDAKFAAAMAAIAALPGDPVHAQTLEQAHDANVKCADLITKVDNLAVGGIDLAALAELVRAQVRAELDATRFTGDR